MGSEAQVQNIGIIWANTQIVKKKLKMQQVCNVHDECTFEVHNSHIDNALWITNNMYQEASKVLKLDITIEGQGVAGKSWLDVH